MQRGNRMQARVHREHRVRRALEILVKPPPVQACRDLPLPEAGERHGAQAVSPPSEENSVAETARSCTPSLRSGEATILWFGVLGYHGSRRKTQG